MAFKNAGGLLTDTLVTQYTCPAGKEAVVHSLIITPLVAESKFTLKVAGIHTGKDIPVVYGGSAFYSKPFNLEAGDTVQASCTTTNDCELFMSVLEEDL